MTQDRENFEQIVAQLVDRIDKEKERAEQKKEIERLKKENLQLQSKVKPYKEPRTPLSERLSDSKLGEYIQYSLGRHLKLLVIGLFAIGVLGGTGFGVYKGCSAPIEREERKVKQLVNRFPQAANQKDNKIIKEFITCYGRGFTRGTNYNFMETVVDKVLNENYHLQKFNLKADIGTFSAYASCSGCSLMAPTYTVEVAATLVSKQDNRSQKLNGTAEIKCRSTNCVFQLLKDDASLCPGYSR